MKKNLKFEEVGARIRDASSEETKALVAVQISEDLRIINLALSIRDARLAAGLTQTQLAQVSSVTQAEISRIEGAKYSPRVGTLFKLAAALNVSFCIGAAETSERKLALQ